MNCSATFSVPRPKPLGSHYTDLEAAARAISLLMEGMSIRATSRLTGLHKTTILSLLLTVGKRCDNLLKAKIRHMHPTYVQADELHTTIHTKQRHLRPGAPDEWGDMYTWLALDSETKMILTHHVGKRDSLNAYEFIHELSTRIEGKFQLTTDGLYAYPNAVDECFGADVDYGQLVKVYSKPKNDGPDWYRVAPIVTAIPTPLRGRPKHERISTSHVERVNLTVRMHCRRFTRLCNGFSKSFIHLKAAVALFVAWYNFCKVHQSIRVTPGMEAGLTDHVLSIEELLIAATDI